MGNTVVTDTTPERDFQQYYDMYFDYVSGSIRDNDLKGSVSLMYAKMLWTVGCSIFCALANFVLLIFLFMDKEQRNLIYFPLMLQALADIIGPGIANAIYEMNLYPTFKNELEKMLSYDGRFELHVYVIRNILNRVNGKIGCFTDLLRQLLNEYTTGVCVALSAFYRYILVCHPTKNILKPKALVKISISVSACILLASAVVVIDIIFNCPLRSCEPNLTVLASQRCS